MNCFFKTGWVTDAPLTFAPDPVRPWEREGLAEVEAWPTLSFVMTTRQPGSWWPEETTTTNPMAVAGVLLDIEVNGDLEWWAWALIGLGAVLALVALAGLVPLLRRFG